jgi:hypothetical protein
MRLHDRLFVKGNWAKACDALIQAQNDNKTAGFCCLCGTAHKFQAPTDGAAPDYRLSPTCRVYFSAAPQRVNARLQAMKNMFAPTQLAGHNVVI